MSAGVYTRLRCVAGPYHRRVSEPRRDAARRIDALAVIGGAITALVGLGLPWDAAGATSSAVAGISTTYGIGFCAGAVIAAFLVVAGQLLDQQRVTWLAVVMISAACFTGAAVGAIDAGSPAAGVFVSLVGFAVSLGAALLGMAGEIRRVRAAT